MKHTDLALFAINQAVKLLAQYETTIRLLCDLVIFWIFHMNVDKALGL